MLKSPRRYISLFEREKLWTIISIKLTWFGGLQKTPIVIDFDFNKSMSKIFSISLQFKRSCIRTQILPYLTTNTTATPLFLSYQRISFSGRLTLRSGIVWSSFDSVIVSLIILVMYLNSTIFGGQLFILIWRKCKPFFVKWLPKIN